MINRIDKSAGYYLKKYNTLSRILKDCSSWENKCTEEENMKARDALLRFYKEYKKCKPDLNYCFRPELGHFSYLIYLPQIRNAIEKQLYQRACNEIYSLLYYDYFLQRRIIVNITRLLEGYVKVEFNGCLVE
jgi:hypothetical protein